MTPEPTHMDISEFRRLGYLQEVNRRFFHPLGLALSVNVDDDGTESLGPMLTDDDSEGWYYGDSVWHDPAFPRRAAWIDAAWELRRAAREKALGYMVQPPNDPRP
jgi:hypothetical protein